MKSLKVVHIILSGGFGSRLWPLSRKNFPKPLLPLVDGKSLLELTISRNEALVDEQVIITNEEQFFNLRESTSKYSNKNTRYIIESYAKNTAPAISIAVNSVQDDNVIFIVTPADHLITPVLDYQLNIKSAIDIATNQELMVLFGISPTEPSVNYGYIELDGSQDQFSKIRSFHEKPSLLKAKEYLQSNRFFWNSGIFCFSKKTFINEMQHHCSKLLKQSVDANKNPEVISDNSVKIPAAAMKEMDNISIDYALIENSSKLACISTRFTWHDLGNFNELKYVLKQQDSNFIQSDYDVVSSASKNNIIVSNTRPIVLNNISDLSIIDTEDVLYISQTNLNNGQLNGFKLVEENLPQLQNQLNWELRPWGRFDVIREESGYKVKKIEVNPGGSLSLQYHNHRCEHWLVISGKATVQLNEDTVILSPGESIDIPTSAHHRLQNFEADKLVIIETQFGDYLGEDDIVRIKDLYDRK